jgi:hypothetical protein
MTFEIVEIPTRLRGESWLDIARKADQCAKWLKVNGFVVLCIEREHDMPHITVRYSPLCEELEGAVDGYSRIGKGSRYYRSVIRFDCEVRWDNIVNQSRQEAQQELDYKKSMPLHRRVVAQLRRTINGGVQCL